jgi:hypothetical protein
MNGFLTGKGGRFSPREGALSVGDKNRENQIFSDFFALSRLPVGILSPIALKNIAKVRCNRSEQTGRPAHDRS